MQPPRVVLALRVRGLDLAAGASAPFTAAAACPSRHRTAGSRRQPSGGKLPVNPLRESPPVAVRALVPPYVGDEPIILTPQGEINGRNRAGLMRPGASAATGGRRYDAWHGHDGAGDHALR